MTVAFSAILDDLLRTPGLGLKITVSASAAAGTASTTHPTVARYNDQTRYFEDNYLWIPAAAAAADQIRTIISHSISTNTTTFTFQQTANFGETLSSVTAYILPVHPDNFIDAANQALERSKVRVEIPLAHGPNSPDMQGGDVATDWTETNVTQTEQTTTGEVLRGAQSLVVVDDGSGGGYTVSGAHRVSQGKAIHVHFEAKADTGTGKLQVIDGSSNEQASISFTEENWVYGYKRVDFDSSDETFTLRLQSVAASDAVDWQRAWFTRDGEYEFILPSWIGNRFKVAALVRRRYLTPSADDDCFLAQSYDDEILFEGLHYQVIKRPSDANPRLLRLMDDGRKYIGDPLFVIVECPWSAPYGVSTIVSAYTSTSLRPQDEWAAQTLQYLGENQGWGEVAQKGAQMLAEVMREDEPETKTLPKSQPWMGPYVGGFPRI